MSCYISQAVSLGCADGKGGIKKIYVVGGDGGAITGVASDAAGEITGFTFTSGTTLYGFELKRNTSFLNQNVQKNFENGTIFFQQELHAILFRYSQEKANILQALSQNDKAQIIAVDQNGVQLYLGEVNGLYLSGGSAGSGTAYSDRNGFEFIWTGQEPHPANVVVGDLSSLFASHIVG